MTYIAKAFEKLSQDYNPKNAVKQLNKDFYCKAINKIPIWAAKPNQYNHKIIAAYFKAVEIGRKATIATMERICSDKEQPQFYVSTFKSNYAQLKIDSEKSNGKVFEDDGEIVWLWHKVEDVLLKYKSSFTKEK